MGWAEPAGHHAPHCGRSGGPPQFVFHAVIHAGTNARSIRAARLNRGAIAQIHSVRRLWAFGSSDDHRGPQGTQGGQKERGQTVDQSAGQRGQRRTGGFWCLAGGWWPDMVGFMPRAMRVDPLLGEHGIGQDSAAGRQEFERQMERRRLEALDEEALKPLRRGWYLGSEQFKEQMLEQMEGKLGESHSGELHGEFAKQRANRIITEELARRGWQESEWATRRRSG